MVLWIVFYFMMEIRYTLTAVIRTDGRILWNTCGTGPAVASIPLTSISECAIECAKRSNCHALTYRRAFIHCRLYDHPNMDINCVGHVHIMKTDFHPDIVNVCGGLTCPSGTVCDPASSQCHVKECASNPQKEYAILHGNMNTLGSRVKYTCKADLSSIYSTCTDSGWSEPSQTCPYCFYTARQYSGTVNVTENGLTCQRWDTNTPHNSYYSDPAQFPEATLTEAENYCRDPANEIFVWCYTTSPEVRWEKCDVLKCLL